MDSIAFIDTEVSLKSQKIIDIGGVKDNGNSFIQGRLPILFLLSLVRDFFVDTTS